jgi:hypothetical protein
LGNRAQFTLPWWIAAAGYPFTYSGRQNLARADLRPQEAMEALKEVTQWLIVPT